MKNKNLIGISGKKGSGKDTIAEIIRQLLWVKNTNGSIEIYNEEDFNILKQNGQYAFNLKTNSGYEVKRFADKLKNIVCMLIGCTREQLEDRDFKEKELGEEWWYYRGPAFNNPQLIPYGHNGPKINDMFLVKLTPRKLLQLLGTDCGREIIHPNIWVNSIFAKYDNNNWIIPDMRFPNELKAIEGRNGITIRINRTGPSLIDKMKDYSDKENNVNQHPSETALDNAEFDYVINNSGTISELIEKVKEILIKEKVL